MDDDIELGTFDPYCDDSLIGSMKVWVKQKDLEIAKEYNKHGYSARYQELIIERVITYKEYKTLFSSSIKPEDYDYYPAFEYGQIESKMELEIFTNDYTNDKVSYARFVRDKGTVGLDFFLRRIQALIPHWFLNFHTYCVAKTRSGKTTLMKQILYNAIKRKTKRESFLILDPHGQFALETRRMKLLTENIDNLVYLDIASFDKYVPTLNIFDLQNKSDRSLSSNTSHVLEAFEQLLDDDDLSGAMRRVMMHSIYALLAVDGTDLLSLLRLLQYFQKKKKKNDYSGTKEETDLLTACSRVPNKLTREFFQGGYESVDIRTFEALLTRLDGILLDQNVRGFLCGGKSSFDLAKLLNSGRVVIVNLDFNKLGSIGSDIIGRIFIAACQRAFSERLNIPEEFRPKTRIFMDECQRMMGGKNVERILSEMGKYEVGLFVAHQYAEQMESDMLKALLSNTYTKLVGANSAKNASIMASEMRVPADTLADVPKYHFQINIDGQNKGLFKASSFIMDESLYISENEAKTKVDQYMIKKYYNQIVNESVRFSPFVSSEDNKPLDETAL